MSIAAAIKLSPRRWHGRFFLLALLPLLLLSGCAVSLVAPYDAVTDAAVQELAQRTETIIADVTQNGTGYAQHRENYREVQGALGAVALRAELYGDKNKAEREVVSRLQQAMRNLERLHRAAGEFRPAEAEGVRSLLRSLLHHELSKKHSSALVNPGGSS